MMELCGTGQTLIGSPMHVIESHKEKAKVKTIFRQYHQFLYTLSTHFYFYCFPLACSTESFYGILCSGLTEKTRRSFISSNSSFIGCVKKHSISAYSPDNDYSNDNSCRTGCTFDHLRVFLPSTANLQHEFTSCKWISCNGESGGGIYLKAGNTVTLSVIKGEFYSCKASPNRGGGIYAEGIKTLTIQESLFHKCIAEAKNDFGGGGIQLLSIQQPFIIQSTAFLSCESGNDGGGISIYIYATWQRVCFVDDRFVGCKGLYEQGSDGGSLMLWDSNASVGCSNTIFADSYCAMRGGAVSYYIFTSANHPSSIQLFTFCFFQNNQVKSNRTNDAYFEDWKPTQPFLHCFSTTSVNRVHPPTNDNNWLPYGNCQSTL